MSFSSEIDRSNTVNLSEPSALMDPLGDGISMVRLVDIMGNDRSIVQAARVSYGGGSKGDEADRKLLRYLWEHQHGTPFEMVEVKFHAKMPIFVARQWVRHRTASINEVSARYTNLSEEWYDPAASGGWRQQSLLRKQGSQALPVSDKFSVGDLSPSGLRGGSISEYNNIMAECFRIYKSLLDSGVSREQARIILPTSVYTEWYWKVNLRNFIHFYKLRADSHAQWEIRVYAEAMKELLVPLLPWSMELLS